MNEIDAALRGLPIRIWRRLVRTTQGKIQQVEHALTPLDLSMTEFDLLAVLRDLGSASQQDVARNLLFTEANMSYHAKRMVARGLRGCLRPISSEYPCCPLHQAHNRWS
ncbi:MarR family transcriptional regulator, partial [Deinococcus sp.]|uniref:MarR family winged helix-turn-helix transcriptional regulator n=1 Tax=Deinococcus sp. TaxID=47478 RepID=UPI0025C2B749